MRGGVHRVAADAPLPFQERAFDAVMWAEMLEHVASLELLANSAVLRPGR